MRKPLSFVLSLLFVSSIAFSQVPLKPLFEEFTSSTCGPCYSANLILDGVLEQNHDTHSAIKYQVDFPGIGDPYFIEACGVRADYYNVLGVPTLSVNGADVNPFDMTQSLYDGFLGQMTNLEIEIVRAAISSDYIVDLEIRLNTMGEYAEGLKAHVAIVEKTTVNNFKTNGETDFFNVLMQMLPNGEGTTLPRMSAGQSETLNLSFDMNNSFMEGPGDLQVVVFVQDENSKDVIQSENQDIEGSFETYQVKFEVVDSDGNEVDDAKVFLNDYGTEHTNVEGDAIYPIVYENTTMDYVVSSPGLVRAYGTVNVGQGDVVEPVVLEIPDVFYYEDFEAGETTDWFPVHGQNGLDAVYYYQGKWIIFRQSGTLDPLYLATPGFNLKSNNGGSIVFNLRAKSGDAEIGFGTMTDPNDISTMNEITTFFHQVENTSYEHDLADFSNEENVHFYWRTKTSEFSWYELDYVFITEGIMSSVEKVAFSKIKVYPNPSQDILNIESDLAIETISIYNAQSQLVNQWSASEYMNGLDISHLTQGLYLIELKSPKGTFIKPVIKQ